MQMTFTHNAPQMRRYMGTVARKQVPFAASKAVNLTARDVKRDEQGKLEQYFEIRTRWLKKSGAMPMRPSSKSQAPYIYATLTVKDEVATLAAVGGTKRAQGGDLMAVPMEETGGGVSAREFLNPGRETLTKSKWPSRITGKGSGKRSKGNRRKKPKPFYAKSIGSHGAVAIRRGDNRLPLRVLYKFAPTVKVEKSWPLVENARENVNYNLPRRFRVEFHKALLTAK